MKAIVYTRYGSPEELQLRDIPTPMPKPNEVLVKVYASSINSWDDDLLKGKPFLVRLIGGLRQPRHQVLGADVAGRVVSLGSQVQDFKIGDEVMGDIAGCGFGGFAEYVSVPENLLARKPSAMSFAQAAALPQAGLLALQGLQRKRDIQEGQEVLINGAGGGVGTLAVQYARFKGARITCVDRAGKEVVLRSLGADKFIDFTREDYTRNGQKYDVILDVIAHRSVSDYRRALKPDGRFVMIGGSMGLLLLQMMLATFVTSRFGSKKLGIMGYKPNRKDLDYLGRLFEEGILIPVIDKRYPLAETAAAFRYFESGGVKGKIIIAVDDSEQ